MIMKLLEQNQKISQKTDYQYVAFFNDKVE